MGIQKVKNLSKGINVLLIEDDDDHAMITNKYLKETRITKMLK